MAVLRQVLEAFIDGSMKVEEDLMRTFGEERVATMSRWLMDISSSTGLQSRRSPEELMRVMMMLQDQIQLELFRAFRPM